MTVPTIVALAAAALPGVPATPAVFLTAQEDGDMVRLEVRGESAAAFKARFTLEANSGSNRTTQAGTANLAPGVPVALVTLNLSGRAKGWRAVLRVEPEGAEAYTISLPAR